MEEFYRQNCELNNVSLIQKLVKNSVECDFYEGDHIYSFNKTSDYIYFLVDGVVGYCIYLENGKEIIDFLEPIQGSLINLPNQSKYMINHDIYIKALTSGKMYRIPKKIFDQLHEEYNELQHLCERYLEGVLARHFDLSVIRTFKSKEKVKYVLTFGKDFVSKIRKKDVANFLDITPENYSVWFNYWIKQGEL